MKKKIIWLAILLAVGTFTCGCSREEKKAEDISDKIDRFTTKTADKAVKKMKTPLDKARKTQEYGEERLKDIDEAMEKQ
ncbi:MAG: hypothetical protein KJ950_00555 [Proteobacteria bacterium]|nr:hypothetical protein [Pseudomonadota bacterium]MBU1685843.1 hypothetical protein [Pseudomonadota bacterium]